MKWKFVLRGTTLSTGSWAGGHGLGETGWTLHANQALPMNSSKGMGKAALLKQAREPCAQEGGQLVVIEDGTPVAAWQWCDAGEADPEASGHWNKIELDPREFQNVL